MSRIQFDTTTEQLNGMFQELLSKITDQEQDWHKVIEKISTEMECKVNRTSLLNCCLVLQGLKITQFLKVPRMFGINYS